MVSKMQPILIMGCIRHYNKDLSVVDAWDQYLMSDGRLTVGRTSATTTFFSKCVEYYLVDNKLHVEDPSTDISEFSDQFHTTGK